MPFKYLGSVITNKGPKPEILSRIAQTTAAWARVKPVWNDRSISLSSKIQLMRSLVTSIFLFACELRALTAELQRRIQAMEMRCYRKILRISYKDHVTEEEVGRQHQGMDRPGVRQIQMGGGEQGKMEETGCEIIDDPRG